MSDPSPRTCRTCGCTDTRACWPPCSWTEPDLCSTCSLVDHVTEALATALTEEISSRIDEYLAGEWLSIDRIVEELREDDSQAARRHWLNEVAAPTVQEISSAMFVDVPGGRFRFGPTSSSDLAAYERLYTERARAATHLRAYGDDS